MNSYKKYLIFIIPLTAVILAEIFLRLTAILIIDGKVIKAEKISKEHIRILTLGESTTDKRFLTKNNKAWPEYLEEFANNINLKIKVYNHGRAAITTNEILNDLDELLSYYKPHIVITMVGINDSNAWTININESILGNLKVYRILSWAYWSISRYFSYKPLPYKGFYTNDIIVKNLTKKEKSQYYAYHAHKIVPAGPIPKADPYQKIKHQKAVKLFRQSVKEGYFTKDVLGIYTLLLHDAHNFNECARVIKSYIDKGGMLDFLELMNAQRCLEKKSSNLTYLQNNQENMSFVLNKKGGLVNYKKIHTRIIESGATHIIMQYPTMPIDTLRGYFNGKTKTFFIENLVNFENALKSHKKSHIFIDNFSDRKFGHTTEYGHRLISKKVLKDLPEIIKTLKKQ